MRSSLLAVLVAVWVVAVPLAPAGAVPTDSPVQRADGSAAQDDRPAPSERAGPASGTAASELRLEYTVALTPERPGSVRVDVVVAIPDSFTEFEVGLPSGAELVSTEGFERGGELDLAWDGRSNPATVSYRVPANRTSEAFDGLDFVDVGRWALVNLDTVTLAYQGRFRGDRPEQVRTLAVAGEGYAGPNYAFLGATEVTTGGGEFTLVVPDVAEMRADREAVFATLTAARDQLAVGARGDDVNVFVGPPPLRSGGTAADAGGPTDDVWVNERSRVDDPDSVWIHEYVHTRQTYQPGSRMAWFDEASAEYYAALLALRQGRATWDGFRSHVGRSGNGTLAENSTWENPRVEYTKGSLVLAALDARIRRASGGNGTLMDVFRALNAREDTVTYGAFQDVVADVAGTRLDGWLDRYVLGSGTPDLPSDPGSFTHPSGDRDPDGDGLRDGREADVGSNPFVVDTDEDGVDDGRELDVGTDPAEADSDGDGLADGREVNQFGSDPTATDSDGDGLADGAEVDEHRTDPTATDTDEDGLADDAELDDHGTDPSAADTDEDGLDDGAELDQHGTDATNPDTDGDGIVDGAEANSHGSDPTMSDTDGDGLADGREVNQFGSDPTAVDGDGDGLADGVEVNDHGTDPSAADSDGDGYDDGRELEVGTDPTSATGTVAFWFAVLGNALGLVARPAAYLA